MKKAKDFIPDGGYSERELNLAFFMFIKGYHQAEKDLELTWEDMRNIVLLYERLLNDKNVITLPIKDAYTELLKRFKAFKNVK